MRIGQLIPRKIKESLRDLDAVKYYLKGKELQNDPHYKEVLQKTQHEYTKKPIRTDIINFLLSTKSQETFYLEIGVRNPNDNYNHIKAKTKYSVDPGLDYKENPVDFKMTSDVFFEQLANKEILSPDIRFDLIFIDGLHLAEQLDKDIRNALMYLKEDGFILIHDCNPQSEWHSRENKSFNYSPAEGFWNGTYWKAFVKWRSNPEVQSCCIDADWGIGVITKKYPIGKSIPASNPFYEFYLLEANRKETLNLMDFNVFKQRLEDVLGRKMSD